MRELMQWKERGKKLENGIENDFWANALWWRVDLSHKMEGSKKGKMGDQGKWEI